MHHDIMKGLFLSIHAPTRSYDGTPLPSDVSDIKGMCDIHSAHAGIRSAPKASATLLLARNHNLIR